MFSYNLVENPNFKIEKKTINNILKKISFIVKKDQYGTINIVFLDDSSIKELNNKYRGVNKETDVLSFAYYKKFSNLKKNDIIGEVIMSESKIALQSVEYGLGKEKEFYKLLIHSVLHILGYDHEIDDEYKIMQNLEDEIWDNIFVE